MKTGAKRSTYTKRLTAEIQHTPEEYLPMLLRIVQSYRESVALPTAKASLRTAWRESQTGETYPLADLWMDISGK